MIHVYHSKGFLKFTIDQNTFNLVVTNIDGEFKTNSNGNYYLIKTSKHNIGINDNQILLPFSNGDMLFTKLEN